MCDVCDQLLASSPELGSAEILVEIKVAIPCLCCWLQLSKFSMKETGLVRAIIVRSCSVFLDLAEVTLVLVCWNSPGR